MGGFALIKTCDICGDPMELDESGSNHRRRKRHAGECTREWQRRRTAQANAENRAPFQYVGPDPENQRPYTLKAFAEFCSSLVTDHLLPLKLEGFQKRMLRGHFGGAVETVIVIPKGNGKTTLLSALAVFHLMNVPGAEVIIAAASRDQARILFKQAASLIQRSGLTKELEVKAGYGEIRFKGDRARVGPRIRVIASDATTADGVIPTLALVDELHRHKDGDLYGVFRDGLGKRGGRMLTISTAGYDLNSALGKLRDMAHTLPTFERTGCYNHATAPSFEWHEWCLTDLDDRADMALVKKANPASFVTPEWLRRRFESPSTTPGQWARYACGLWTSGEDTWIEPMVWDALKADIGGVSPGDEVFLAIRVTQGGGCGIGIAAPRDEERIAVACEMLPYDFPGLEFRLRQLHDIYRIRNIYGYAPQFGIGVDVMRDAGLPMEDLAQSPMRLMEATSSFRTLVASHRLIHDGDPELRKQVLSGRVKEAPTGSYLMPTKEVQGLVAVILAADQASQWSPRPLVLLPAGVG